MGAKVECLARGDVTIVGTTAGRIPWPIGQTKRAKSPVLYGALAKAIRSESTVAIRYWFGFGSDRVWKWRKALGVPQANAGTTKLLQANADTDWFRAARAKAHTKLSDPARCEKIAAAKRGKPRPRHVIEAMRKGRTGLKHTAEARQKMSEANRRRGARPPKAGRPWEAWENELLPTLRATEVAAKTGRTMGAVYTQRYLLDLSDGRTTRWRAKE